MAEKVLTELRKKRDEFRDTIKKNAEANERPGSPPSKTGGRLEGLRG